MSTSSLPLPSLSASLSEQTLHADCYCYYTTKYTCEPGQARLHFAALREIAGHITIVLRRGEENTDEQWREALGILSRDKMQQHRRLCRATLGEDTYPQRTPETPRVSGHSKRNRSQPAAHISRYSPRFKVEGWTGFDLRNMHVHSSTLGT